MKNYDFEKNHFYATSWVSRYDKFDFTKYPEMESVKVKIGKNHGNEEAFVMVSFKKNGVNFANPVEFNQGHDEFVDEFKKTFNYYVKEAEKKKANESDVSNA